MLVSDFPQKSCLRKTELLEKLQNFEVLQKKIQEIRAKSESTVFHSLFQKKKCFKFSKCDHLTIKKY